MLIRLLERSKKQNCPVHSMLCVCVLESFVCYWSPWPFQEEHGMPPCQLSVGLFFCFLFWCPGPFTLPKVLQQDIMLEQLWNIPWRACIWVLPSGSELWEGRGDGSGLCSPSSPYMGPTITQVPANIYNVTGSCKATWRCQFIHS